MAKRHSQGHPHPRCRIARRVLLGALVLAALAPASAAADFAPVVPVPAHVTLRGPGTINDAVGGATLCSAPLGTPATHVTMCDGTALSQALVNTPPTFTQFQVILVAQGPIRNGSPDNAGWTVSGWNGACSGTVEQCGRADPCTAAGPTYVCATGPYTANSAPLRVEPVMHDNRAPTPAIAAGPPAADAGTGTPYLTPDGRAHFTLTTDENQELPSYQCSVDGAALSPCTSSFTTAPLSSNFHTLQVHATDNSGLAGPDLLRKWDNELDPKVAFVARPAAFLRATSFAFSWLDARIDTNGYFCRFDSSAPANFNPCASPTTFSALAQGAHHLDVQARIHAINGDDVLGSVASAAFTVDTIAPDTRIDAGPDDGLITNQPSQAILFTGLNGASGFQCSLDKAAFTPCASPDKLTGLKVGQHTFTVRAIDQAGNLDPTPETRSWRVISHFPNLNVDATMSVKFFRKYTLVTHLFVSKAPKGSTIKVSCKGKGCKKKSVTQRVKKKKSKIDLVKLLKSAHLGKKAVVTVQVTQPGFNGVVVRFKIKITASPSKSTLCLPSGATKPRNSC